MCVYVIDVIKAAKEIKFYFFNLGWNFIIISAVISLSLDISWDSYPDYSCIVIMLKTSQIVLN